MTTVLSTPLFTLEVPERGAAKGHARIISLSSATADISLLGFCASVISSLLYEKTQAGGTSIVMTMAKGDARIDILARHENDGIDLQWPVKPGDPAQLDAVQERIRAKTFFIKPDAPAPVATAAPAPVPVPAPASPPPQPPAPAAASHGGSAEPTAAEDEHEDYLSKQLHRIP